MAHPGAMVTDHQVAHPNWRSVDGRRVISIRLVISLVGTNPLVVLAHGAVNGVTGGGILNTGPDERASVEGSRGRVEHAPACVIQLPMGAEHLRDEALIRPSCIR